jgi:hypothetical protein
MVGKIAICCLALGLVGCAIVKPDVPTGALAARVLPPASDGGPETGPSVSALTDCPKALPAPPLVETDQETLACLGAEPLTLERAAELALERNPSLEALRERIDAVEGGRIAALADFLPESRLLYRHVEGTRLRAIRIAHAADEPAW